MKHAEAEVQVKWKGLRAEQERIKQDMKSRFLGQSEVNIGNLHQFTSLPEHIKDGLEYSSTSGDKIPTPLIDLFILKEEDLGVEEKLEDWDNQGSEPGAVDSSSIDVTAPGSKDSQGSADDMDLDQETNITIWPRLPATSYFDPGTSASNYPYYPCC